MPNIETMISYEDTVSYRNNIGQLHRNNGPAVVNKKGYKAWWINGQRHRMGGPAIIRENGDCFWYYRGELQAVNKRLYKERPDSFSAEIKVIPELKKNIYKLKPIQFSFDF